jgi:Alpha-N-acetylglucosaminidase (NAGLU) C-terminal domain
MERFHGGCIRIGLAGEALDVPQRLKPHSFCGLYGRPEGRPLRGKSHASGSKGCRVPASGRARSTIARSILTSWGDRTASEAALDDYGNKDWTGLSSGLYLKRWTLYFADLRSALQTGKEARPIDWFALSETWNREHQAYPRRPHGDSCASALRIAQELHLFGGTFTL